MTWLGSGKNKIDPSFTINIPIFQDSHVIYLQFPFQVIGSKNKLDPLLYKFPIFQDVIVVYNRYREKKVSMNTTL